MSSSESEFQKDVTKSVSLNLLPSKSKKLYTTAYNTFKKWRKENQSNSFSEDVLLAYFEQLKTKYAPPSLWATYSMLKCTIGTHNNIDIGQYSQLTAFLKNNSLGYRAKKSQVFSRENISKFLSEAPDEDYLCEKVALIFGITGALRRDQFVKITVGGVKRLEDDVLLVQVPKTKSCAPRTFIITNELFHYCWKYLQARPENCPVDNFFLRFTNGSCTHQAIGINKFGSMPKEIAQYLQLPDARNFTGHSFRRTPASFLFGIDITTSHQQGGLKSTRKSKKRIREQITNGVKLTKQTKTDVIDVTPKHEPSTSENGSENISSHAEVTIKSEQPSEPFHHVEIDLKENYGEEVPRSVGNNYIFNNCNVTISDSSGIFTFNKCMVERVCTSQDKSIQTDECW